VTVGGALVALAVAVAPAPGDTVRGPLPGILVPPAAAARVSVAPRDRFFGEDKGKHFFTSFLATVLAGSAARAAGVDADASAVIGAGAAMALGVGKEIVDLRNPGGSASLLDLLWDAGGVGTGYAVLTRVQ
jgi:uncharacterized protein YfiM (DUF2279 family)